VLWGEADPWLDPRFADAYGARLANAQVTRVPEAGHWPWLDQPALVDQVIEFLS
jgi:pimeloyl-ACP methyl ester carboxylesterase